MPGKVKVKIISGKNLPVMDRSSDTTDAYVEIKLGNTTYKTDVCRRTLHPQWNTDWYRFEIDDSELQDEPLQIRLMDHDTYSANDAIGKVYLNLNPLLLPVAGQLAIGDNNPHHEISGWIPVYDTMHGIRGEVNVTVKVELFSDFNRYRQSSCGVHFFYSSTVPQGFHAKIINGFVEELIVDDDPEYQWIDKIRTPRASNEARQTLFFKLSGELQRKIGVKALSLGGNAVIGYRQNFDLEGESGIVARGIGTAVTLVKAHIIHHLVAEPKEEEVENYLKFVGDGKSFSLCSTSPSHKLHFPVSDSLFYPGVTTLTSRVPKLTKQQFVSLDSNTSPSMSIPNLYHGDSNIKVLLNQEEKRGKSAMSRRFQKFKHSQKSLSKKMIALKAKLNDSIGEESDQLPTIGIDKRKLFKRTSSDSSAMAEILARSVMKATTSLSCILEDQPQVSTENETMEKLDPIANLLSQSENEISSVDEMLSDAQSCSSTDSSSSGSDFEYRDYNRRNNDVETISNIITNVELLQRCLSREGLLKQYSLPAIPTKGFSLSSLDNLHHFESSTKASGTISENTMFNESLPSISTSVDNLSQCKDSLVKPEEMSLERRCSDTFDSRLTEINKTHKMHRLTRFEEIDLPDYPESELKLELSPLTENRESLRIVEHSDNPKIQNTTKLDSYPKIQADQNCRKSVSNRVTNNALQTMLPCTPVAAPVDESDHHENKIKPMKFHEIQLEPESKGIVKTALQTMLLDRSDMLGTKTLDIKNNLPEAHSEEDRKCGHKGLVKTALKKMYIEKPHLFKISETHKQDILDKKDKPRGIVQTALQTMLIERADLLGTPETSNCNIDGLPKKLNHDKHTLNNEDLCIEEHEPESIVETALQTMLIERADLLRTPELPTHAEENTDLKYVKLKCGCDEDESNGTTGFRPFPNERSNMLCNAIKTDSAKTMSFEETVSLTDETNINRNEPSADISVAPVRLDNIDIEQKKMVKTAMQTMLLEKLNLLGTYTPPTSPSEWHSDELQTFTFNELDRPIPKSSSTVSFGEREQKKETVLGMPFISLSSLTGDNENNLNQQKLHFLSESYLNQSIIETLKDTNNVRKKRFKFLSFKGSEKSKHGMFHKFRKGSKKHLPDEFLKERHPTVLSKMFHHRHDGKSNKDEQTQTSMEFPSLQKISHSPKMSSSPNSLYKTKITVAPPEPPSQIDLALGDFIAHSKTKSACITSHHSSPAQERQYQSGSERKDNHSPDSGNRTAHSPVKVNYMGPLHRRSSDSDLSITPKGNSLTGSDKSMGTAAAYFMRNHYTRRGQLNQEHLDMLEYPFLTMTQFPPRFILQIGGSISARSVKLLERILNVDEPESRDIWWSEIRMEIRSHARSLNCNAVLGYTELTSICDDVCVLSACGTAAVIDFNSSVGDDDNFSNVQLIHKNSERDKYYNGHHKYIHESPEHKIHSVYPCYMTHLPYDEKSVPLKAKVSKCPTCLKGRVPEVLIATIEPPESIPSVGKGCFIESHVSRSLKDVKGETIAKEISDGLPFLEYELHRLLVNKLKIKGMNAIFSLKTRITIGEKMLVGVATGTAIYVSCLPSPDLPLLVTDKLSDEKLVADLQAMLHQTVEKNKEIYQIKEDNQKGLSDDDSDGEQPSLDISCGNKDCCILEMDDPEDAEVLRLLMQEKVPEGFHVVSTESVPGLEDLEVVKNLQMFTQIYRAKLTHPYNLQKHFVRLLQSVYFKLRRMVPCALCDLQFRIDIPEPDEIQLCVIGMALGLGKKVKKSKSAIVGKKSDDDLIFKLDDEHAHENVINAAPKSNPSTLKFRGHRSPSKYRTQSMKHRHIPHNERHGVDITPLSYVPGGNIEQYLGNLNFFFIRETTSIREEGGLSGFIHSFITEVLAIVRSHVTALGGNALVAFFMNDCVLNHNLHKNQGQCLINVGGDVVSVSYYKDDC